LEFTINEILLLISSLSDHELYGVAWYKQWTLGRMIQFNTSSPMKNMRTKFRRFNRGFT
ncbi:ClbS/DfsB family four-helix bundle protein, partial [Vibrio parahaemolyticus]